MSAGEDNMSNFYFFYFYFSKSRP